MKKYIISGIAVVIIAAVAAVNMSVSKQSQGLSRIMLTNIEALAQESGGSGMTLDCWHTIANDPNDHSKTPTHKTYCGSCEPKLVKIWSDSGTCTKN
jgi:hypothetical protein